MLLTSVKNFAKRRTEKHSGVHSPLLQQLAGPGLSMQSPSSLGAPAQSCGVTPHLHPCDKVPHVGPRRTPSRSAWRETALPGDSETGMGEFTGEAGEGTAKLS